MAAGSTAYPTAVETYVDHSVGDFFVGESHTTAHNNEQLAIQTIQNRIGFGSANSAAIAMARVWEATFTETSGAGTYTASLSLPAGSYLIDVIVHGVALWNASGACSLKVGDVADDDGIFTAIDLKATSLLAAEGVSASGVAGSGGGVVGADLANSQWNRRYLSTARVISGIISAAGTAGTLGRTRLLVIFMEPTTTPTAATKV